MAYMWAMWDMLISWLNAARGLEEVPFTYCDNSRWRNQGDIDMGQMFAIVMMIIVVLTQGGVLNWSQKYFLS
jgi:hypothetical protein